MGIKKKTEQQQGITIPNEIQHGMIGFVSSQKDKSFLSRAIQFAEGSMWNHAFLVIEEGGKLYAYEEGTLWGIIYTPLEEYLEAERQGKYILAFAKLKNIPEETIQKDKKAMNEYCRSLVGRDLYAFWQLPQQFPRQLLQRIGINLKYPSKGFVCSVLVAHILNKFYGVFKDWKWLSPDDLHESDEITFVQINNK
jgi:hypothetical protein